ncbi:bifunctional DNA-formamidopyrimidine glycosylase/DNA-(apurinic or apyrimidinic site) lyase [Cryobacterium melibiosiphilum]|uniref:Formamidopyrimidine-DNA glycosylase n=1 Tax=Cryobacterium melibiosiphilum TaxID=995039 RepID=A0A3A5MA41_9MICO|nr:bifunctional DNA-formamidopyrimidine glycosylase/DNA-(apurinic or apyrimidinic site) lyase [Cryobacterium melibiosiphilum]RJT84703.1 bifunctional DNA-formamidopyrimidine glycosylase/DNA-(apurinic or apyrimidinic site) lyase [Cryobacterium melibiosiphilum]
MPELPEVEVVRAGLDPALTGASVTAVEVFEPRSLRRHDASAGSFVELLDGQRMLAVVRRGKFLWVPLSSGQALVAHLGMSGQVLLRAPGAVDDRMLRIRLKVEHPVLGELWVHFVDQRIFGSMAVDAMTPTADGRSGGFSGLATVAGGERGETGWQRRLPSQVAHIARDPLDPAFSAPAFYRALARKKTGIKRVLLDQTVISGIGNIYADEALFAAKVHYEQPASSLSLPRARVLLAAVRTILQRALVEGGTSFDAQYVNVNGESGYFSHSLSVYGQQGTPCARCGTLIVREQFMNRGSHLCPRCQRLRPT